MVLPFYRLRFNWDDAMDADGQPAYSHRQADVTERWIGDRFGYGARHAKTNPRTLSFDPAQATFRLRNDDGLFTPLGVSDRLTPKQLTSAHAFELHEVGGDAPILLWRGTIQRQQITSADQSVAAFNAFERSEAGSRAAFEQIAEVPRSGDPAQSASPKSLFRQAAQRMGVDVDDSRYEDPPEALWRNSVIRWPEPASAADLAEWTMLRFFLAWAQWSQQPVFTLRDGNIGTLGLRSPRADGRIDLATIDILDGFARPNPDTVTNVAHVRGIDLLEGDPPAAPPPIPRGLRLVRSAITDDSLTFTWSPVAAAAHYVARISGGSEIAVRGGTQITFPNLIANTRYSAEVRSVGPTGLRSGPARAEGQTARAPTGTIEGPDPIPLPITPRAVSTLERRFGQSLATITVTWDRPAYAEWYQVSVSAGGAGRSGDTSRYQEQLDVRSLSAVFSGLLADTDYTITLRPANRTGTGEARSITHRTGSTRQPVRAPYNLQIGETGKSGTPPTAILTATWSHDGPDATDAEYEGIRDYTIEVTGLAGGTQTVTQEGTSYSPTTGTPPTQRLPAGAYGFRVRANGDDGGESAWISATHTISAVAALTAPTNVAADASGPTSIDVTWTEGANATSHEVQRKLTSDAAWPATWDAPDAAGRRAYTGLLPATSYQFRVRAVRGTESEISAIATESTDAAATLGAPTNLRVTRRTTSSLAVAYTGGANATSHRARIKLASATSWGTWAASTDGTHEFSNLSADTLYDIEVQAQRAGMTDQTAALDDERTAAVVAQRPGPVQGLSAASDPLTAWPIQQVGNRRLGVGEVDLAWSAPATGDPPTGYEYRVRAGTGAFGIAVPVGLVLARSVPSVAGTAYRFEVRAENGAGKGDWSSVDITTPAAQVRPGAPTLTAVTSTSASISIAWTAPAIGAPITGYEARFTETAANAGSGSWEEVWHNRDLGLLPAPRFTKDGLKAETRYWVELRAVNSAGAGPADSEAETTDAAPVTAPAAITDLAVPNPAQADVLAFAATWTLPARAEYYQSRLRAGTGAWSAWARIPASALTLTSTGATFASAGVYALAAGTGYTLEVRAVNAAGNGGSDSDTFTTPAALTAGAVTGLRDLAVTTTTATFTWTDAPNATSHQYRYAAGTGAPTGAWQAVPAPGVGYKLQLTGLSAGTAYVLQVRGVRNAVGGTAAQDAFTTTAALAAPTLALRLPATGTRSLIATIGDVGGAEYYELRYGTTVIDQITGVSRIAYGSWRRAVRNALGDSTISGLAAGTRYTVQARARRGAEEGPASEEQALSTRSAAVPAPTVSVRALDDDRLEATWTAVPLSNQYVVQYRETGTTTWLTASGSPFTGGARRTIISGLDANTEYEVQVRGRVGATAGGWGRDTATTLLAAPVATGITAGIDNITASVSALPAGATGLRLRGGTIPTTSIVADTTAPYDLLWAGLRSGQRYSNLAVQAFSAANESAWVTLPATSTTDIRNLVFALAATSTPSAAQMVAAGGYSGMARTITSFDVPSWTGTRSVYVAVPQSWGSIAWVIAGTSPLPSASAAFTLERSLTIAGVIFNLYRSSASIFSLDIQRTRVIPEAAPHLIGGATQFGGTPNWADNGTLVPLHSFTTPNYGNLPSIFGRTTLWIGVPASQPDITSITNNGDEEFSDFQKQLRIPPIVLNGVEYKFWANTYAGARDISNRAITIAQ